MICSDSLKSTRCAAVAAAYVQLDAFEYAFRQGPDDLWQSGLVGEDRRLLRQLVEKFSAAESVLRSKVWSEKPAAAPRDAINEVTVSSPPLGWRAPGIFGSLPRWHLI